MASFFTQLSREQVDELLPKAKIATALYHRHGSLLAQSSFRKQITDIDADIWWLLILIYEKKICSRKEMGSRIKQQEQSSKVISVQITHPERHQTWSLVGNTVTGREDVGLVAVWQGKVYKRTLSQDVALLLR